VNIKFDAFDLATFGAMRVEVVAVQGKFGEFFFELVKVNAQINHGANEHVAADAAENIEVKSFQFDGLRAEEASSLIWLAA
jgi:hypothetical protein